MATSATEILNRELPMTLDWISRFRLSMGIIVCFCLCWYGAEAIGLPAVPKMAGSLLSQSRPSVALGVMAFALVICTVLGRLIVGHLLIGPDLQFEGGLMAALLGMFAVVFRLGPMRYALFAMDDPRVYVLMAAELMLLYVVVGFCWISLQWAGPSQAPREHAPISHKVGALATHVVVMGACMMFISKTDATSQALAAVGISAVLASMAAHIAFPVGGSAWFLMGPVVVGVIGYGAAFLNPDGLSTGLPQGLLGALALPTPLAYATAGPAGAIFGFWVAHRWHHESQAQAG